VCAGAQRQPQVVTELPDVGSALTADPKQDAPVLDGEWRQIVDRPDASLPAHGAFLRRRLVDRPLELVEDGFQIGWGWTVQLEDSDVLFGALQKDLGQAGRIPEQNRQTAGHFRVQRPGVGGPLGTALAGGSLASVGDHVPDPAGDLVGARARWLVEVDHPERQQGGGRTLGRRIPEHQKS